MRFDYFVWDSRREYSAKSTAKERDHSGEIMKGSTSIHKRKGFKRMMGRTLPDPSNTALSEIKVANENKTSHEEAGLCRHDEECKVSRAAEQREFVVFGNAQMRACGGARIPKNRRKSVHAKTKTMHRRVPDAQSLMCN
eukprot:6185425-Pleurochrysis_carterae.AAC.2